MTDEHMEILRNMFYGFADMVVRRMENTDEDVKTASDHVFEYISHRLKLNEDFDK